MYRVHLPWTVFELTTLVVIDTDFIGSCKSNYHTIPTTMPPNSKLKLVHLIWQGITCVSGAIFVKIVDLAERGLIIRHYAKWICGAAHNERHEFESHRGKNKNKNKNIRWKKKLYKSNTVMLNFRWIHILTWRPSFACEQTSDLSIGHDLISTCGGACD